MKEQFKVGVAKEVINPCLGTHLYGYPRIRPASAVRDDLNVSAVVFEKGDLKGAMISADICSVTEEIVDKIRTKICEEVGIPKLNINFSATHTHSGPPIKTSGGWGVADVAYIEETLIPQTVKATKTAYEKLQPAVMGVGTTECKMGMNRRQPTERGGVMLGQNPYGVHDSTMTVLAFKNLEGEGIVNLVHYGCHGTASAATTEITRDWIGVVTDGVEIQTNTPTVVFNGAEGDVGPRLSNGRTVGNHGYREMEEVGAVGTIDAVRTYKGIREYREVDFKILNGKVSLPYKTPMNLEQVKERLAELGDPEKLEGTDLRERGSLLDAQKMLEEGKEPDTAMVFDQALFAFNSTVFVPFPFEMFAMIALRLRYFSPYQNTLCTCNTNGSNFYLPTQEDMIRGGYEVVVFKRANYYRLLENTDTTIVQENLRIMRENN